MKRPLFCNNNVKKVIMISVVEAITDTNVGGAGRLLLNRIKNSNNNVPAITIAQVIIIVVVIIYDINFLTLMSTFFLQSTNAFAVLNC